MVMDNNPNPKKQKLPQTYTPDQLSNLKTKTKSFSMAAKTTKSGAKKEETATLTFEFKQAANPTKVKQAIVAAQEWNAAQ